MKKTLLAAACAVAASAGVGLAVDLKDCNVEVSLENAIGRGDGGGVNLTLEFQVRGGQWQKDFVHGRGLNQGRHTGAVKNSEIKDGVVTLTVEARVKPDMWMGGGRGAYTLVLKPGADGKGFEGTFNGTFTAVGEPKPAAPRRAPRAVQPTAPRADVPPELMKMIRKTEEEAKTAAEEKPAERGKDVFTVKVSGKAIGLARNPWPEMVPGHVPVQPGEHPRLIFRRADVEKLRKQAETPEGKAIMDRFWKTIDYGAHNGEAKFDNWPGVGIGFAYQMTGDKKYAERAMQLIKEKSLDRAPIGGQDIHHGPQLQGLALTYDLCCEAWDEAFRQRCVDEIWQRTLECGAGTYGGGVMGGANFAYWSNHNGIRVGAAALGAMAVWQEKHSSGRVLGQEALDVAADAAYDQRGWLEDGCGGGYWFMEGVFYKGMTMVRGLSHSLRAFEKTLGQRINAAGIRDCLIAGYFLESPPGRLIADGTSIDHDSLTEVIWTIGLCEIPPSIMPGFKYLLNRSVGMEGNKTFGLERGCYAPYLMAAYPFDVQEKPPAETFPWISPDVQNGHWVFRNTMTNKNDILLTWNLLSGVRGSCHWERIGDPAIWQLYGLGQQWLGGRYHPLVKGKETALGQQSGPTTLDWKTEGRMAVIKFDVARGYMPPLDRPKGDRSSLDDLAKKAGAFRAGFMPNWGPLSDFGIRGTRHVAVDFSGASGAPLLLVIVEDLQDSAAADAAPKPAEFTWQLPLAGAPGGVEGKTFKVVKGDATLSCLVLGGELTPQGTATVKDGKLVAVLTLQKGEPVKPQVEGDGVEAKITVGKRSIQFTGGALTVK